MSNVATHYEQLLAEHYVWMFGVSFEQKVAEQKALLDQVVGICRPPGSLALQWTWAVARAFNPSPSPSSGTRP